MTEVFFILVGLVIAYIVYKAVNMRKSKGKETPKSSPNNRPVEEDVEQPRPDKKYR